MNDDVMWLANRALDEWGDRCADAVKRAQADVNDDGGTWDYLGIEVDHWFRYRSIGTDPPLKHCIGGPAGISADVDAALRLEWFVFDEYHRTDGPAIIEWNADGEVVLEEWWIRGERVSTASHETTSDESEYAGEHKGPTAS
ncbi:MULTISPECIES: hypothetical protein [Demequina]|uniref:hypothetical protein n=1 Tax=Demequina TaxID=577469 RepID=UPI00078657CF|nr:MULTISPECIES: hypothetical protein [Demequina]